MFEKLGTWLYVLGKSIFDEIPYIIEILQFKVIGDLSLFETVTISGIVVYFTVQIVKWILPGD